MVSSRHRLHHLPQRRQRWHPLGRNPALYGPHRRRPLPRLPLQILLLLLLFRQRRSIFLLRHLQILAHDERGGANVKFRKCVGLVLLDVDDRIGDAMGLEGRLGQWHLTVQNVEQEFQLHECRAGFRGAGVE